MRWAASAGVGQAGLMQDSSACLPCFLACCQGPRDAHVEPHKGPHRLHAQAAHRGEAGVPHGLVPHGSVARALVPCALVPRGLMPHGLRCGRRARAAGRISYPRRPLYPLIHRRRMRWAFRRRETRSTCCPAHRPASAGAVGCVACEPTLALSRFDSHARTAVQLYCSRWWHPLSPAHSHMCLLQPHTRRQGCLLARASHEAHALVQS
jgi:hypothetical protein